MAQRNTKKSHLQSSKKYETDTFFVAKIAVYLLLGSFWIYVDSSQDWVIPLPVGLILGLVFATHEHFRIDRKIEYVILLTSSFIAFWLSLGLYIEVS